MPKPLAVSEATGDWDPTDFWTDAEFEREYARQVAALPDVRQAKLASEIAGFKYSPDQPRDDHGRFGETGDGGFRELSGGGIDAAVSWALENIRPDPPLTEDEKAIVGAYVGSAFESMNAGLRGIGSLTDTERRDVATIDGAIEKSSLPEDLMLYRGFGNTEYNQDAQGFIDSMRVGVTLSDPAFLSTTLDLDIAQSFAGTRTELASDGWLMRIEAPAGTPGLFVTNEMASSDGEVEVLLGRDTPLTVTNLDETNRVVTVRIGGAGQKYSPDQPRDDHGRFGETGGGTDVLAPGQIPRTSEGLLRGQELADRVMSHGGFTVDPRAGTFVKGGFAVAMAGNERAMPADTSLPDAIEQFQRDNAEMLAQAGNCVGAWHDDIEDSATFGMVVLDISHVESSKEAATEYGRANRQTAIFDLEDLETIDIRETSHG